MSGGFLDIVTQKLDLDSGLVEQEVNAYLIDLAERIRSEPYRVEGFGTFVSREGEIVFEPDSNLADAVNFRYAGLVDLEIPAGVSPGELGSSPGAVAEVVVEPEETPDGELAAAGDSEAPAADDKTSPDRPTWQPVVPSKASTSVPEESSAEAAPKESSVASAAHTTESNLAENRPPVPPSPSEGSPSAHGDRTDIDRADKRVFPILSIVFIMIAVIAGAVYFLRPNQAARDGISAIENTESGAAPGAGSEQERPADDLADNARVDRQVQQPETPPPPAATQSDEEVAHVAGQEPDEAALQPMDDGFASDFDRSATGYTLMVGSIESSVRTDAAASAREAISRYSALDLPRAILSYEEDGSVRYRLALGRFDTIEEAQQEIERLGNRIPGDTWVWRIR